MSNTVQYLMSPEQFNGLSRVRGFNNLNGETYQDHICIILDEYLNENQKNIIKSYNNIEEALKYLSNIVSYTHNYVESKNNDES